MTRTPFGIATLVTAPGQVYSNQLVKAIAALGASYVVMQVLWTNYETAPGVYSNEMMDDNIQQYNDVGLDVYYCILTAPSWRKSLTTSSGAKQMGGADVLSLVEQLLARYYSGSPHGTLIGVGLNEDFSANTDQTKNNFGYATDVLNAICPVIQSANYGWVVGGPAHFKAIVTQVIAQQTALWTGGGVSPSGPMNPSNQFFSNYHLYRGNGTPPDKIETNLANFNQMWQTIAAVDSANGRKNDIWSTEFAWQASSSGNNGNVTYEQQAYNLAYCMKQVALSGGGVSHAAFYTMQNEDANSITGAGTPLVYHPAYYALQGVFLPQSQATVPVTATFRDGQTTANFRDGSVATTFRDGIVTGDSR